MTVARRAVDQLGTCLPGGRVPAEGVFRLWRRPMLVGGLIAGVFGICAVAFGLWLWYSFPLFPIDTHVYFMAGARVNAGGHVYDLGAQDWWPADHDRRFTLFGPPLIVLPWRLLALLPEGSGILLWLVVMTFLGLVSISYATLGTRGWGGFLLIGLAPSTTFVLGLGNVDNLVLASLFLIWAIKDRPMWVGLLIGVIVSLKLTPAVLLVWLLATRRLHALAWALGAIAGLALITALATELGVWARYARVIVEGAGAGEPTRLLLLVVGFAFVLAIGRRLPAVAFAVAVALMPIGSPQAAIHSYAVVLAVLAPVIEVLNPWLRTSLNERLAANQRGRPNQRLASPYHRLVAEPTRSGDHLHQMNLLKVDDD